MENGKWASNNAQKTERFIVYLEKTFRPTKNQKEVHRCAEPVETDEIIIPTPIEGVTKEIIENINSKRASCYDLITVVGLKNLPRKVIVKLTNPINTAFRLTHVSILWKVKHHLVDRCCYSRRYQYCLKTSYYKN